MDVDPISRGREVSVQEKASSAPGLDRSIAVAIGQAKGYDQAAFGELYRFAVGPIHRYLSVRVRTVEEAEDLTQEVFLSALAGIQGLRAEDETAFLAWLFQIARNKLADHLRQRYRKPSEPFDEDQEVLASDPQPDEAAEANEEREQLRRALEELTPEQREVIVCKYVLEYGNEQTARLVGKNTNAVNQLHHRALASLHRLLTRSERAR